jgi:hypothetical protein
VVPWALKGAHWAAGTPAEPEGLTKSIDLCAQCGEPLPDTRVFLIRHRGEHRIPDGFCSVDHMGAWAKAGGRWQ